MKKDNVLSMLGIAAKAGSVASGEFQTEHAVKSKKARLVIVAEDASENTKNMFFHMCDYYQTELLFYGDKESLGHSIGKEYRASLAITDQGLAASIKTKITQKTMESGGGNYGKSQSI